MSRPYEDPTYHVGIATAYQLETDTTPALYTIRWYDPEHQCENFPFGAVGPGHPLKTVNESPCLSEAEAEAFEVRYNRFREDECGWESTVFMVPA